MLFRALLFLSSGIDCRSKLLYVYSSHGDADTQSHTRESSHAAAAAAAAAVTLYIPPRRHRSPFELVRCCPFPRVRPAGQVDLLPSDGKSGDGPERPGLLAAGTQKEVGSLKAVLEKWEERLPGATVLPISALEGINTVDVSVGAEGSNLTIRPAYTVPTATADAGSISALCVSVCCMGYDFRLGLVTPADP